MTSRPTSESLSHTERHGLIFPRPILAAGLVLLILTLFTFWGGSPSSNKLPAFIIGVSIALLIASAIGAVAWFGLYRPLPSPAKSRSILTMVERSIMGSCLTLSMVLTWVGGSWDEIWHFKYGVPFGSDFFWRPHLLLYSGISIAILCAAYGWLALLRRTNGSFATRLRTDPPLAQLMFTGLFMFFALPADPIWHEIYGTDITALSFPHILLALFYTMIALCAASLSLSAATAKTKWRSLLQLRFDDILPLVSFSAILLITYLLLASDWVGIAVDRSVSPHNPILQRPYWLFPTLVLFTATWVGTLANHALRTTGTATLIGITTMLIRIVLVTLLGHETPAVITWLMPLPTLIAIDLAHIYCLLRNQHPTWLHATIAAVLSLGGMLPLMSVIFPFPEVTSSRLLLMITMPALIAGISAWLGQTLGNWLAECAHQPTLWQQGAFKSLDWILPALTIPTLLAVALYIATAVPPIVQ